MKRIGQESGLAVLGLLLLTACGPKGPTQEQYDALSARYDSLANDMGEAQGLINSVTCSLDSISMQEGLLFINNEDGSNPTKQQILERLQQYKDLLARQRVQLQELKNQQGSSARTIRQLKEVIAQLEQQIAEKEGRIAELESDLASKKRDIAQLQQSLAVSHQETAEAAAERDQMVEVATNQDKMLNTGYFIIATKSELKDMGLIKGVFKKKADYANLDKSKFTEIDIRTFTELNISSTKVKLITDKPEGSYTLTENSDETTTLRITNPTQFWESSSFLIIQSK